MHVSRTQSLTAILLLTLVLATLVLSEVIWTVVFGVTVAYMLVPLVTWMREAGLSKLWASVVAAVAGTTVLVAITGLVGFLVYRRRGAIAEFVTTVPDTIPIELLGMSYVVDTASVVETGLDVLAAFALQVARSLPTLGFKLAVFGFVVFGLLIGHEAVEEAFMTAVPRAYHDVASAFARRIEDTLYAIYVLQVATGVATFVLALPVFVLLGYEIPTTLAFIAGVLQFLPIVGPSVLLGVLALYHVTVGEVVAAVLVVVVGGVVIAWLPDLLVRPRLASRAGNLPGTLYLIGFVGGLLTLGPIGIIVGPLAVALVVEAVALLGAESG